jgi:proteic killer suppression protein
MITSFRCKDTEKLFQRRHVTKFPVNIQRNALRKLLLLDAAERLDDLQVPPGNRLELAGIASSTDPINDQWRYVFVGIRCLRG